jgi:hypothetical protein
MTFASNDTADVADLGAAAVDSLKSREGDKTLLKEQLAADRHDRLVARTTKWRLSMRPPPDETTASRLDWGCRVTNPSFPARPSPVDDRHPRGKARSSSSLGSDPRQIHMLPAPNQSRQDRTNDRRDPEQPELADIGTSREERGASAASRVD